MLNQLLAWYPMLTQNDTLDMSTLVVYANNVSHGILFPIMLLVVFLITLLGMTFSGQTISRSVLFGGFICSILSIPLVLLNLKSLLIFSSSLFNISIL